MTRNEATQRLKEWKYNGEGKNGCLGYIEGWFSKDDEIAFDMAIEALEFLNKYDRWWEEIKTAGLQGKEVIIHHGGRSFKIREVAQ